jgi:hypothetical protein
MPFAVWSQPCVTFLRSVLKGTFEGILPVLHGAQQWREDIPQKVTELPRVPGKIPSFQATVESHPNVEKHDVRMGHPATQNQTPRGEFPDAREVVTRCRGPFGFTS